ncbi:hypothetical protein C492_00604 [Natronococcus jeotgali DSM 18795]|uniref:Uncharacterized protein n=1 Tax=Natronococcus jeotgali DSM 18795 TaxID=1227498 RepID=L9XX12_9EURY|nr:hypothetical protein C492_00604 [Natronococcus jeotgali DSM 18795]
MGWGRFELLRDMLAPLRVTRVVRTRLRLALTAGLLMKVSDDRNKKQPADKSLTMCTRSVYSGL